MYIKLEFTVDKKQKQNKQKKKENIIQEHKQSSWVIQYFWWS